MIRSFRECWLLLVASVSLSAPLYSQYEVNASLLGSYATGIFDESAAEIGAWDAATQRFFVTNANDNTVDVIDLSDPTAPNRIHQIDLSSYGAGVNSVAVSNGVLAAAVESGSPGVNGQIVFLNTTTYAEIATKAAGDLPDMVTFSPDGNHVLAANEGEPNDDYTTDPEGTVTLIDISGGIAGATPVQISFTAFNAGQPRAGELPATVRISGPGATVAQDLEPEYIAVSPDNSKAYVSLQENNAVAIIDIATGSIDAIVGLGAKDFNQPGSGLDANKNDDTGLIETLPMFGLYQPDALAAFEVMGTTYFITANEGDGREYEGTPGHVDETDLKSVTLDPAVFSGGFIARAGDTDDIGDLTIIDGMGNTDMDADLEEIYIYGSRSFTIWNGSTGNRVYDSGDMLEQLTLARFPANFNASNDKNDIDNRSDNKGPEPEAVTTAVIDGRTYAFVGLERIGGVVIVDVSNPAAPEQIDYVNNRNFNVDPEVDLAGAGDLGPEGIVIIPASESTALSGNALMVVTSEVSGTTTVFELVPTLTEDPVVMDIGDTPITRPTWRWQPVSGATQYIVSLDGGPEVVISDTEYTPPNDLTSGSHSLTVWAVDGSDVRSAPVTATVNIVDGSSLYEVNASVLGTFASGLFDVSAAEIGAWDPATERFFVTNANDNSIDVIDLSDPTAPNRIQQISLNAYGSGVNSVAVSNGVMAIAMESGSPGVNGQIVFLNTGTYAFIAAKTAGDLPDMVTFSPDGSYVLAANEGEPSADYMTDPEGSVTLIDISGGIVPAIPMQIGFSDFNAGQPRAGELPADVRISGPGASVAQDLEPEYIAVSPDNAKAFVSLQENNAMAIIDLATGTIDAIVGLGAKDFSQPGNGLDADKNDDTGLIEQLPIFGLFQPDAVAAFNLAGNRYVISANEGDGREYGSYTDETDLKGVTLDAGVFDAGFISRAGDTDDIGDLKIIDGLGNTDADPELEEVYAYGARSFSIWNGTDGSQVYDSGDLLEQITLQAFPANFNASNDDNAIDDRSDNKGPEPEAVTTAEIEGRTYAFVGLERMGGVVIMDVTNPAAPTQADYINNRDFGEAPGTAAAGDLGPEGIVIIPASESTAVSGNPLMVVTSEVSGTTTVFELAQALANDPQLPDLEDTQLVRPTWDWDEVDGATSYLVSLNGGPELPVMGTQYTAPSDLVPGLHSLAVTAVDADGTRSATVSSEVTILAPAPLTLTILHNNDGESSIFPDIDAALGAAPNDEFGGAATFVTLVDQEKAAAATPIMLSSGDNYLPGTVVDAGIADSVPFSPVVDYNAALINEIGYDALAIGNHEFDLGPNFLADFIGSTSSVPFLSANLDFSNEARLQDLVDNGRIAKSTLLNLNGQVIGVIGATTENLAAITNEGDVVIGAVEAAVEAEIAAMQLVGVDKIILISHLQSLNEELTLIGNISGVDVVIAGGGDEILDSGDTSNLLPSDVGNVQDTYPIVAKDENNDDVFVVTTPGSYRYLGRLVIDFDAMGVGTLNGGVTSELIRNARADGLTEDADTLTNVVNPVEAFIASAVVVAESEVDLETSRPNIRVIQTNMGAISTDAFVAATLNDADFTQSDDFVLGLTNGGGIRTDRLYPAGDVTDQMINNIFPFGNDVRVITGMSTDELLQVLEHAVSGVEGVSGRWAHISGFTFSYDPTAAPQTTAETSNGSGVFDIDMDGERVVDVFMADGTQVVDDGVITAAGMASTYALVTNGFILDNGDRYPLGTVVGDTYTPFSNMLVDDFGDFDMDMDVDYADVVNWYLSNLPDVQGDSDSDITASQYAAGTVVNRIVALDPGKGADLDMDGIDDHWEQLLIDALPDDAVDGLDDVTASSDFDGDQVSDLKEFEDGTSGTDAAFTLAIGHNNDGESALLSVFGGGSGAASFVTLVNETRAAKPNFIMLSSGDNFLASIGRAAADANGVDYDAMVLDAIGYDAIALGNHEFDLGEQYLADFINATNSGGAPENTSSTFPFLSANLDFSSAVQDLQDLETAGRIASSAVINVNGREVGVIGAVTPNLAGISSPGNVAVLDRAGTIAAINAEIAVLLGQNVDIIILISHLQGLSDTGGNGELDIIDELDAGLDVVIAGGGDELLDNGDRSNLLGTEQATPIFGSYPLTAKDSGNNDVYVVTTPGEYKYLGLLELTFDNSGVVTSVDMDSGLIPNTGSSINGSPDATIESNVEDEVDAYEAQLATIDVVDSEVPFDTTRPNIRVSMGNWGALQTDAYVDHALREGPALGMASPYVVGLQNGGGIRNNDVTPAGMITYKQVFDEAPFDNDVVILDGASPAQLLNILEAGIRGIPGQNGAFLHVSGLTFSYDPAAQPAVYTNGVLTTPGQRIQDVFLGDGTLIIDDGVVVPAQSGLNIAIVTNSFSANNGDNIPFRAVWDLDDDEFVDPGTEEGVTYFFLQRRLTLVEAQNNAPPINIVAASGYAQIILEYLLDLGLVTAAQYAETAIENRIVALDAMDGADLDMDGIDDHWEQILIDALGDDAVDGLDDVDASTDFDGDGDLDITEFQNGTNGADVFQLVIGHNNDGESALLPVFGGGSGAASFVTLVNETRAANPNFLMLSSGDNFLASIGRAAADANGVDYDAIVLDAIGYDAIALGNHEFDLGEQYLADFINATNSGGAPENTSSSFPFLSANLDFSSAVQDLQDLESNGRIAASAIIDVNGRDVGVIGAVTPNLAGISSPGNVAVADRQGTIDAINAEIASLQGQSVDIIILISHLQGLSDTGGNGELDIIDELDAGLDVVIAGGGDELLDNGDRSNLLGTEQATPIFGSYPLTAQDSGNNDVLVVTTPGEYKYLGLLKLTFDANGKVAMVGADSGLVPNRGSSIQGPPDADIVSNVEDEVDAYEAQLATIEIVNSEVAFDTTRANIRLSMGNWGALQTDAYVDHALTEGPALGMSSSYVVGLQNGGGIRNNDVTPAGMITYKQVFDEAPFDNDVVILDGATPAQILDILEAGIRGVPSQNGAFLHVSGLTFSYDPTAQAADPGNGISGARIQDVYLSDGTLIIEDGVVVPAQAGLRIAVVTNSFSANNGDNIPFRSIWDLDDDEFVDPGTEEGVTYFVLQRRLTLVEAQGNAPPIDIVAASGYAQIILEYLLKLGEVTAKQYAESAVENRIVALDPVFGADLDQDGIDDHWEQLLIDANGADMVSSIGDIDGLSDFDQDGVLDIWEYFFNGNGAELFTLAIGHNNDGESALLPVFGGGAGAANFVTLVRETRAAHSNFLMLSSGDNFLASIGRAAADANGVDYDAMVLDAIGYDAIALGNHEFDLGEQVLADFINATNTKRKAPELTASTFPFLSANLDFSGAVQDLQDLEAAGRIAASTIITKGGREIGVIGAVTPNLAGISSPGNIAVADRAATIAAINSEIVSLQLQNVDIIILISHLQGLSDTGGNGELDILDELTPGLDLVIAGGGDELLDNGDRSNLLGTEQATPIFGSYPLMAQDKGGNDVYVVTTPGEYKYLGLLELTFDAAGKVVSVGNNSGLIPNVSDSISGLPDANIISRVEDEVDAYEAQLATIDIVNSEVPFDTTRANIRTSMGNWGALQTDAYVDHAVNEGPGLGMSSTYVVGLQNGGGIRNNDVSPAGMITYKQVFDEAPFDNDVVILDGATPAQLLAILEAGVRGIPGQNGAFLHVSGMTFSYDPAAQPAVYTDGVLTTPGSRVQDVYLGDGTLIIDDGMVVPAQAGLSIAVVTNSFSADNGDNIPFRDIWDLDDDEFVDPGTEEGVTYFVLQRRLTLVEAQNNAAPINIVAASGYAQIILEYLLDLGEVRASQYAETAIENRIVAIDPTNGADLDLDGIDDHWEQILIDADGSDAVSSLADVDATTDFDGDFNSDISEFQNGGSGTSMQGAAPIAISNGSSSLVQGNNIVIDVPTGTAGLKVTYTNDLLQPFMDVQNVTVEPFRFIFPATEVDPDNNFFRLEDI